MLKNLVVIVGDGQLFLRFFFLHILYEESNTIALCLRVIVMFPLKEAVYMKYLEVIQN